MSKELEALENYLFNEWKQNHVNFGCDYKLEAELEKQLNNLKSVKQALKRLESIDNAKPSEAIECVDYIEKKLGGLRYECERMKSHKCDDLFIQEHIFTTIKQALLKAQEQEKVLSIIKEKDVDIKHLKWCINNPKKLTTPLLNYNIDMNENEQLTKEEYDLLKRWLG